MNEYAMHRTRGHKINNTTYILVRKPQGNWLLRIMCRKEFTIKPNVRDIIREEQNWICLAHDRIQFNVIFYKKK
jgi:hypothetical protein